MWSRALDLLFKQDQKRGFGHTPTGAYLVEGDTSDHTVLTQLWILWRQLQPQQLAK